MASIQDLREARNVKARRIHEIAALDTLTSEQTTESDTLYGEIAEIDAKVARITRANELLAATALAGNVEQRAEQVAHDTKSDAVRAFTAFLRRGFAQLGPDDAALIRQTMSTTTQGEGGYTVPAEIADKIIVAMKQFGAMRSVATVIKTATGGPLNFPAADPTSELGAIVAENAPAAKQDTSFSTIGLPAFEYTSNVATIPLQLLQDSIIDIEGYVVGVLARRLGLISAIHYTTGSGVNQPFGVVTQAQVGFAPTATGEVTSIKPDSLIELFHSVDPVYRAMTVGWMFNDTTLKTIRKIKDVNNRYMFIPGYETGVPGGVPDTLLGKPITVNQQMPSMAASATSILFGDFSYYTIRDVADMIIRRFDDSAFALSNQAGFCAWMRTGGNLLDVGGAVKSFVNSAT